MNYYQHHIGDYRRDTAHLSLLEHGVYRQLLDMYYLSETKIAAETDMVYRRLCARTDDEKKAVDTVLSEFFKRDDGWIQTRCNKEIDEYQGKAERARINGKLGGRPSITKEVIPGNPEETKAKANHKPLTINHKPLTINQEPVIKKRKEKTVANAPDFVLPDWVDRLHWDAWHASPKRKKATPAQKQLAVDKLAKWRDAGIDHAQALESSAVAGWQGLFEPRATNGDHRVLPFQGAADKRTQQRTQLIAELTGRTQGALHDHRPSDPRDTLDVAAYRVA